MAGRAVELATAYVSLTIDTKAIAPQVGKMFSGVEGNASKAGVSMGRAMAKGFEQQKPDMDALVAERDRAFKKLATLAERNARDEENAARKVEIARAKATEAIEKYGESSSQALTAVDRLSLAEQKLEANTLAASDAQKKLEKELSDANVAIKDAAKSSQTASKEYAAGWKGVGQRVKDHLKRGVKGATDEAETVADRGGKEAGGRFSQAFKGAAAGVFAAVGIREVFGGVMDSVNLAGAAEQSVGAVDSVFKEHAKQMHDWSESAATAVGVSANEYRELGTLLGAQLKNAKTPMDELAGKTNDLIKTGSDLASMFGGSTAEAVEALSSALKGEMDPIEKYGISLNETALKAVALENGLIEAEVDAVKVAARTEKMELAQMKYNAALAKYGKDSVQAKAASVALKTAEAQLADAQAGKIPALDGTTKAMAVQLAITQQSKDALGNFASESDTFAHKQQVAAAQWEDLKIKIGNLFLPALSGAMGFISSTAIPVVDGMVKGLAAFGGWVKDNAAWLVPLAAAVAAYAAAMGGLAIIGAVQKAMAGLTVAQWALNTAMAANPIGIIIALIAGLVAAVVWLYKNNETARRIIDGAWTGIKNAVLFAWKNVIKPAFDWIAGFVKNTLGPIFTWLWTWIIKPVWGFISEAIKIAWGVIETIFLAIKWYIEKIVAPIFQWFWKHVIKPIWGWISGLIKDEWEGKIRPILQALGNFIEDKVAPAFQKGVDAIAKAWQGIQKAAAAPINFVIDTVYNNGLRAAMNKVREVVGGEPLPKLPLLNWGQKESAKGIASGGPMRAFAKGGFAAPGWALVGEEGPELVNFSNPGILLCSSSRAGGCVGGIEDPVDLAGQVAFQAAADLLGGAALGLAPLDVGTGLRVVGHSREDCDVQGPVQSPVATTIEAVADGVARRRRDGVHPGQGGEGGLGADPPVMGPCGEADGGGHWPDAGLLEQRSGLAGLDEFSHAGAVGGDLLVELDHALGQTDRLGPGGCGAQVFVAGPPPGYRGDLRAGQGSAGVDSEFDNPQQRDQRVDGGGALGAHVVTGRDQDAQAGPDAFGQAWAAQLAGVQGKDGRGDAVCVQRIRLAKAPVAPRVHPCCFDHLVTGLPDCGGQAGTIR